MTTYNEKGTVSPSPGDEDKTKNAMPNRTDKDDERKTKLTSTDTTLSQSPREGNTPNSDEASKNSRGVPNGAEVQQIGDDGDNASYADSIDDKNDAAAELDFSTFTLNNIDFAGDMRMGETGVADMLPVPPDGGYGWVIVFAAFMSNFVVDGISNSFGAFMTVYQKHFGESKAVVSLIGSLLIGSYLLIGPLAGGLVNKYGARSVVIAGSILTGLSFVASIVSPNVYVFMLFYGLLGGAGFGLIYLPSIVCVSFYFESKRSMATGIAVAGSGAGTFAMPPLCIYFITTFGWQVTVCILAGIALSCVGFGALYKPLTASKTSDEKEKEPLRPVDVEMRPVSDLSSDGNESPGKKPRAASAAANGEIDGVVGGGDSEVFARLRSALSECENDVESPTTPLRPPLSPITENKVLSKSRAGSTHHTHADRPYPLPPRSRKLTLTSVGSDMTSTQDLKQSRHNLSNQLSRISARSYAQSISRLSQCPQSLKGAQSMLSFMSSVDPKEFSRPMNRRDIFYQGSIKNLREFAEEGRNYRSYRESQISIPASVAAQAASGLSQAGDITDMQSRIGGSRMSRMTGGLAPDEEELFEYYDDSKCKWIPLSVRNALNEMVDIELLKEPVMMLLCLSNLLGMLGFYVPFMFVIDMAAEKGISKENASLLLSVVGIMNTLGRIAFGWIADRGWISALTINNMSLVACGVLTCICPLLPNFMALIGYAVLFGFIIAAYICLTSIVLADLLGLERLTNSFGLLVVSRGIASLLGTPIAGVVYDVTSSYDASFYFAGGLIIFSGVVSCAIPYLHRQQKDKIALESEEPKEADAQSGKLSVLTERSEENLTEYQRTIQSLRQQQKILQEYEEERKRMLAKKMKPHTVSEHDEDEEEEQKGDQSAMALIDISAQ
uniref:MFS domain-containing protein n=2 Tax=Ascaris TaxID=6251 RepID=A0A0M3HMI4_ASCLU